MKPLFIVIAAIVAALFLRARQRAIAANASAVTPVVSTTVTPQPAPPYAAANAPPPWTPTPLPAVYNLPTRIMPIPLPPVFKNYIPVGGTWQASTPSVNVSGGSGAGVASPLPAINQVRQPTIQPTIDIGGIRRMIIL